MRPGYHSDRRYIDHHLRDIALHDCVQLNKPVKPTELMEVIQRLLSISQTATHPQLPKPSSVRCHLSSLSSTTTATFARRFAVCSRKMAGPLKPIRPARHSSTPIVRPRSMSLDRCLPARNERIRIAAAPK